MTVRLRPHHLLCVLTYSGKGYSPAFVENFDRVSARIAAGDPVTLVEGPDDVCAPRLADPDHHCVTDGIAARDAAARAALAPLLGPLPTETTIRLDSTHLADLRQAFTAGTIRAACTGCEWAGLCTIISSTGFPNARLPSAG